MSIWFRFLGILCLLTILAGCTPQLVSRPGMIVEEEPITLHMAWWGGQMRNEATAAVIDLYEQQNPHVHIKYEYNNFNEYWKKLAPYAAGNTLPDIIQMDISYLSQYSSLNLLEDLAPYMDRGIIDTSDMDEGKVRIGEMDGKVYGMSLGVNALMGYYDPEILREQGIEEPTVDWTWDDFYAMGNRLHDKDMYLGTYFTPEQFFAYYLRQHGMKLYAEDGQRLGYEDDTLFIDYFGRMQQMAKEKLIFPPDIWASDIGKPDRDPFYRGQALFNWGYSNQFIATSREYGKPLAIAPMPGPHSQEALFLKPGMFFSVASNSRHKEEAARFISFFVNDIEANKLLKGERGVPLSSRVKVQIKQIVDPEVQQVFDYVDWVERNSSPMDSPDPVSGSEVTAVLREIYDQLLFGRVTPEQAARQFREEASAILGEKPKLTFKVSEVSEVSEKQTME